MKRSLHEKMKRNFQQDIPYGILGDSGILPLIFKKMGNMPLFANYIRACPCFDTRLSVENRVMPDQTLKKKKLNCMEPEFQEIEFHAKKNCISVIAPYSR